MHYGYCTLLGPKAVPDRELEQRTRILRVRTAAVPLNFLDAEHTMSIRLFAGQRRRHKGYVHAIFFAPVAH